MAYTRQDLISLVLQNVGVLAAGQEASIEDRAAVDTRIDPKLAELAKREIITGLNGDALDGAVFLHVADIIASACRAPFGITGNKAEVLTTAAAEAEASLKLLSRQYSTTAATEAFDVVRHVLEALGVVTVGQDPSAQDRGVVTARVAPMLADLRSREIIAFADLASADAAHRRHLATILTASCAPVFGVAGAALVPFVEAAGAAEKQLRALARQFDTGVGTSGTFSVAQSVLELLGVVEGGQTATAKDVAVVTARFAPLVADLRARHVIDLASVDAADASAKHFLAAILAARCAPLFGVGEPMLSGLRAEEQRAEAALRASARQGDSGVGTGGTLDAPQSVLEILGVVEAGQSGSPKDRAVITARLPSIFADLKNRELVDVTTFDAADASVQPHLIDIIAARVAPLFIGQPERLKAFNVEALRAEDNLRWIARQLDNGVATGGTFDLVQVTLENLGAVAVGRTATDKDRSIISGRVTAVLDDLRQREVISIPSLAGANPSTLLQLSVILTSACAMAWGIPADVRQALRADAERAEIALRAQSRQLDSGVGTGETFDLPQAVLEALGVIDAGQTASTKDRSVVQQRVAPVLADLRAREIIDVANLASAPDAVKVALSVVVTAACAPAFQVDGAARGIFEAAATAAEGDLRAMARQFDTGSATSGAYDLTQAVLEMLGVVGGGQTATAKDRAVVSARVPLLLADLRDREIIAVASLAAASDSTKLHLAALLAERCAPLFGLPEAMLAGLKSEAARAEAGLRLIARQLDTGAGTAGQFDVAQIVLETLGVVTAGQTASAKDRAIIEGRFVAVLASLRRREIITLASVEAADAGTLPHLATILAAWCAPQFGIEAARLLVLKAEAQAAEAELRRIARQLDTGAGTSGAFDAVQAALEALGVVEAGQTASDKDRAVVSARVVPMLADLRRRDIIDLATLSAADAATQYHLAAILAGWCSVPFKLAGDALAAVQAGAAQAEAALRLIGRQLDGGIATAGTFDVVQAVLENLSVVAAGYTGSAKDRAVVSARLAPTLADLRLREIANVASIEAADPGVLIHLSVILTSACSQAFGKDANTRALLAAEAAKAEAALKALARQLDKGSAVSGRFDPVQVVLEHIGIVSAGQTASAADRAVIEARVQPKLLELHGRDICGVTDLSMLSPELQGAFARILAADCALSFSEVPPQRLATLQAAVAEAEHILRYQSFIYDARRPLRVEAFWGGRRRGSWVC